VLRRIIIPKRDEMAGGLRKLVNEELHNLYPSPNIYVKEDGLAKGMQHELWRRGIHIGFWWESKNERTTRKI
jgi:hypothetical protein